MKTETADGKHNSTPKRKNHRITMKTVGFTEKKTKFIYRKICQQQIWSLMSTIPTTGSAQLTEQYGAPLYLNSLKMV
jgi:hypothetical protein